MSKAFKVKYRLDLKLQEANVCTLNGQVAAAENCVGEARNHVLGTRKFTWDRGAGGTGSIKAARLRDCCDNRNIRRRSRYSSGCSGGTLRGRDHDGQGFTSLLESHDLWLGRLIQVEIAPFHRHSCRGCSALLYQRDCRRHGKIRLHPSSQDNERLNQI